MGTFCVRLRSRKSRLRFFCCCSLLSVASNSSIPFHSKMCGCAHTTTYTSICVCVVNGWLKCAHQSLYAWYFSMKCAYFAHSLTSAVCGLFVVNLMRISSVLSEIPKLLLSKITTGLVNSAFNTHTHTLIHCAVIVGCFHCRCCYDNYSFFYFHISLL